MLIDCHNHTHNSPDGAEESVLCRCARAAALPVKFCCNLHLYSCLPPHPPHAGRGPRFFDLPGRSESTRHQGFAMQNRWDAPSGAAGRQALQPIVSGRCRFL